MKACLVFRNKKGSSSIMVMLIMIVLVVFGVLTLMSSYSDFKLAKKNAAWHEKYYDLDAKGEKFVSEVNDKLKESAAKVSNNNSYIKGVKSYLNKLSKKYKIKTIDSKGGLTVNAIIEDSDKNKLSIGLEIRKFQNGLLNNKLRYYKIVEWKQLPKEFKYEGQNDIWNGEVTNP